MGEAQRPRYARTSRTTRTTRSPISTSPTTTTSLFTSLYEDLPSPSSTMYSSSTTTTMPTTSVRSLNLVEQIRTFGLTDVVHLHAWYVQILCMNLLARQMSLNEGIL